MTARPRTNGGLLVGVRLSSTVTSAHANTVRGRDGRQRTLPGQGGVVVGIGMGEPAGEWVSDHVEPGASLGHDDPAANIALQTLACVGNAARVTSGPAAGARGVVYGKHGNVLVAFEAGQLARLQPGDAVAVDTRGVGLKLLDFPDVAIHSCAPELLEALISAEMADGRLEVATALRLPAQAAAGGIGMPSAAFNLDLEATTGAWSAELRGAGFGAIVILEDHDHTVGRQYRPGWLTVGSVAHGSSAGGGHGVGMVSLISGPADLFHVTDAPRASLSRLLPEMAAL